MFKYLLARLKLATLPVQSMWLTLAAIFILASASPSSALIIWGYDGSPAMEKKHRFTIVDYYSNHLTLRRNLDPSFILASDLDYLSGIGTRVFTNGSFRVTSIDHATVTLVTPKHLLVAEHYEIWNQPNTFAFVGTDNRMYLARSKPGFISIRDPQNPTTNQDIALIELETALPPAVVPLHLANFTAQHRQQVTNGMPSYNFGNMHLSLNYSSWQSFGNGHYKGVGTNAMRSFSWGYVSFTYDDDGLAGPRIPGSTNWADYWNPYPYNDPLPPIGTAFARVNDSSAPVIIRIRDAANRLRPHAIGFQWGYSTASSVGRVYPDLLAKIAAYNAANGTNYSINNTSLNPVVKPAGNVRVAPGAGVQPVNQKTPKTTNSIKTAPLTQPNSR